MSLPSSAKELRRIEKLVELRDKRLDFAIDHHRNSFGKPLNFDAHFLHDIYYTLSPELVLQASVQACKTEMFLVDHFAMAAVGLSLFYVLPKHDAKNRFVQNRVDKSIAYTPEYKRLTGRDTNPVIMDSCSLKSFNGTTVVYAGSNSADDFRETPAAAFFVDEQQHCDLQNLRLLEDRLEASDYKFKRWAGNPWIPGRDINASFLASDQQFWHVPCLSCGRLTKLDWFQTIVKEITDKEGHHIRYELRDTEFDPQGHRDIHALCPYCDGILDRLGKGKWIAENPGALREGFHINKMMTGKTTLHQMWADFVENMHSIFGMQWFYSSCLGLPYMVAAGAITPDLVDDCATAEPFVLTVDEGFVPGREHDGPCSMGIDVGKMLDVRISRPSSAHREAVFVGKVPNKGDLFTLMKKFNVQQCVMDANPELHLATEVQDEAPCDVWLCYYRQGEGRTAKPTYNDNSLKITVDRTFALDQGHGRDEKRLQQITEKRQGTTGRAVCR